MQIFSGGDVSESLSIDSLKSFLDVRGEEEIILEEEEAGGDLSSSDTARLGGRASSITVSRTIDLSAMVTLPKTLITLSMGLREITLEEGESREELEEGEGVSLRRRRSEEDSRPGLRLVSTEDRARREGDREAREG